jgi:hypothetical protein
LDFLTYIVLWSEVVSLKTNPQPRRPGAIFYLAPTLQPNLGEPTRNYAPVA